jgi:hypothetical protein
MVPDDEGLAVECSGGARDGLLAPLVGPDICGAPERGFMPHHYQTCAVICAEYTYYAFFAGWDTWLSSSTQVQVMMEEPLRCGI